MPGLITIKCRVGGAQNINFIIYRNCKASFVRPVITGSLSGISGPLGSYFIVMLLSHVITFVQPGASAILNWRKLSDQLKVKLLFFILYSYAFCKKYFQAVKF